GTCCNFWPDSPLPLGSVRFIRPTQDFPQIRLRFTPAAGHVYGSSPTKPSKRHPADSNLRAILYNSRKGTWTRYIEPPVKRSDGIFLTIPPGIYTGTRGSGGRSKGYFDDECDGLVYVELNVGRKRLHAYARIGAGPPTYA